MPHKLKAREYKMLLNPAKFANQTLAEANAFWHEHLKPLVEAKLASSGNTHEFSRERHRIVRFWDTPECSLTEASLNLRLRQETEERDKLTLKLRKPASDRDRVADTDMPGSGDETETETEFEEDIGPPPTGSRFALSTTIELNWGNGSRTMGDLQSLFPTILNLAGSSDQALSLPLESGPVVNEYVVDKATVMLEAGVDAKFDLTIWNFEGEPEKRIVEISFSYKIKGSSQLSAERATEMFSAMQSDLGEWVSATHSSKTAQALPQLCGKT